MTVPNTQGVIEKIVPPLMEVGDLSSRLGEPNLKIFDVRGTWQSPARSLENEYRDGHIPGAVFLDWTQHFLEQGVQLGMASVCSEDQAADAFTKLGISHGDTVVLYDDYFHMFAGRLWWAMRYWGYQNVVVLNGGFKHWKAEGCPVSTDIPMIRLGNVIPNAQKHLRITLAEYVRTRCEFCTIDGRGEKSYCGTPKDKRSGHIPGAINFPFSVFLDERTGVFKDAKVITRMMDRAVLNWRTTNIVASCGSGYSGTIPMIALANLGIETCLFDESFAIWKQDLSLPVERCVNRKLDTQGYLNLPQ